MHKRLVYFVHDVLHTPVEKASPVKCLVTSQYWLTHTIAHKNSFLYMFRLQKRFHLCNFTKSRLCDDPILSVNRQEETKRIKPAVHTKNIRSEEPALLKAPTSLCICQLIQIISWNLILLTEKHHHKSLKAVSVSISYSRPSESTERLLTCEDDQENTERQADRRLPSPRQASHDRRDDDFCGNVELQGKGDEDPKTVEQLDSLVHPVSGDKVETRSEQDPHFTIPDS